MQKPRLGRSVLIGPECCWGLRAKEAGSCEGVGQPASICLPCALRPMFVCHWIEGRGSLRRRVEGGSGAWKRPFRSVSDEHMRRGFWIHFANCADSQRHLFSLTVLGSSCVAPPCGCLLPVQLPAVARKPTWNPFQAFWPEFRKPSHLFPLHNVILHSVKLKTVLRP